MYIKPTILSLAFLFFTQMHIMAAAAPALYTGESKQALTVDTSDSGVRSVAGNTPSDAFKFLDLLILLRNMRTGKASQQVMQDLIKEKITSSTDYKESRMQDNICAAVKNRDWRFIALQWAHNRFEYDVSLPSHAATMGDERMLEFLMLLGMDVRDSQALRDVVNKGTVEECKLLLAFHANPLSPGAHKRTLLHDAATRGQTSICKVLIDARADIKTVDAFGRTALHCAAESCHRETYNFLVSKGADPEARDKDGVTPRDFTELWPAA